MSCKALENAPKDSEWTCIEKHDDGTRIYQNDTTHEIIGICVTPKGEDAVAPRH